MCVYLRARRVEVRGLELGAEARLLFVCLFVGVLCCVVLYCNLHQHTRVIHEHTHTLYQKYDQRTSYRLSK